MNADDLKDAIVSINNAEQCVEEARTTLWESDKIESCIYGNVERRLQDALRSLYHIEFLIRKKDKQ